MPERLFSLFESKNVVFVLLYAIEGDDIRAERLNVVWRLREASARYCHLLRSGHG